MCRRGLNYLLTDPLAKELRVDGLHLAIALFFTGVRMARADHASAPGFLGVAGAPWQC
jgi:hypothetical protein